MVKPALHIHAGPKALAHIREYGLRPEHIGVVPAAAGAAILAYQRLTRGAARDRDGAVRDRGGA